jgi:DNA-binding MarR family transcriptional regulator
MKDMAEDLGISSPAMTPIIDKLVESGQLARSEDKLDRRVIRISITSQGKRSMEKSRAMMRSVIDKLISTLSREEQASLDQILRKLLSHYNPTNRTIA